MIECAIMTRAKVLVLPPEHPAASMLRLADAIPAFSWSSHAKSAMINPDFVAPIVDIVDSKFCAPERLVAARADPV